MKLEEKAIYHQIVPIKLVTDIVFGLSALPLCWDHQVWLSLLIGAGPPILVSGYLIGFSDLKKYKKSELGKKMINADPLIHACRLVGFAISATGAWYHNIWIMSSGLLLIAICWWIIIKE